MKARARAVGPRPIGYLLAATKLRTPQEELLTTNKAPLLETQMIGTLPWPALIFCRREPFKRAKIFASGNVQMQPGTSQVRSRLL